MEYAKDLKNIVYNKFTLKLYFFQNDRVILIKIKVKVMLVTMFRCHRDIVMLVTILNLSPRHFVSNIRRQH